MNALTPGDLLSLEPNLSPPERGRLGRGHRARPSAGESGHLGLPSSLWHDL